MKNLSASRRSSVNELCSFVGATQVESIALLSNFSWNVAVRFALHSNQTDLDYKFTEYIRKDLHSVASRLL